MAYYLAQKHLDDAIMKMIETETGRRLLIQFKNVQASAEERAEHVQKQEQKLMELSQQIVSSQTEAVKEKAGAEVAAVASSISKGILFGKEINGNNVIFCNNPSACCVFFSRNR